MDRREQRSKKRTAVTKEQALNFLCANDAAEQNRGVPRRREKTMGSRSPAGPRRLGTATRISASLSRRLSASFWRTPGQDPKAAKFAVLTPGPGMFVNVRNAPRVVIPPPSEMPPVSPCVPLCAIFLREPSVYPFSSVKANVGHLCEKLKNAIRSGLGQRCGGNFLAIFAGVSIGEKSNFTGRFFKWRRPFENITR